MNNTTSHATDRKQRYKQLYDNLTQIHNSIGTSLPSETCQAVRNIIQTCDDIHKEGSIGDKLENPSEVVLDAQIIKSTHESISKLLLANAEFNDGVYQNAISALISNNDADNWQVITKIAINVSSCVATKSSMLGAIDIEPKERVVKERQQRRRTVLTQEKKPETLTQLKRCDRGAEKMSIILKQLSDIFRANKRQPIPYYKLIIDPNDFMNTVENAFQMAFLARDGNVAIEPGSDGQPQVRLATSEEMEIQQETSQSICSLNMDLCKKMIQLYGIRKAMLYVPNETDEDNNDDDNNEEDSD